jgi:hypothetical protein
MSFRIRYFLSHLILSFIVGCLTAATVYWVWYPGVLAKAIGVSHIFLLLLCIDITVGPILTLFLAKEGKKGLWFDLITVVIIQFVALIYGIWHIAEGRPAWQTLNIYRVELVKAIDMDYTNAKAPFSHSPWGKPQWVMVRPAKDKQETSDWIWLELENGKSPAQRAELYQPLEGHWQEFSQEVRPLQDLGKFNPQEAVDAILQKYPEADGFLPMMSEDWDMTVLLSKKEEKILDTVDLRPW